MSEHGQRPSDVADKYILRLPDGMRAELKEAARQAGRTLNAEIVMRLQESFLPRPFPQSIEHFHEMFERMASQVEAVHKWALERPGRTVQGEINEQRAERRANRLLSGEEPSAPASTSGRRMPAKSQTKKRGA